MRLMNLTDQRIAEFRKIYQETYGEQISLEDARAMALRLIELYRLLMRPLPEERSSLEWDT